MPLIETEAIVLRTYRLGEADKIVSLFTRQMGRVRAVASGAQRTKSRYGGTLESLGYVRLWLYERENRDLGRLNSVEIIESFFDMQKDYSSHLAAQYLVEVAELLLPEREVNDRVFRLMLAVLRGLKRGLRPNSQAGAGPLDEPEDGDGKDKAENRLEPVTAPGGGIERPLLYFDYWFLRVAGVMPDLEHCASCGRRLIDAFYGPSSDGLVCAVCRTSASPRKLGPDALAVAGSLRESSPDSWFAMRRPGGPVRDLRRFLENLIEFHAERKLITRELLEQDSGLL
ncbi:MAG TPA: DNA repair protein RecO [Terriglobia bacterium]